MIFYEIQLKIKICNSIFHFIYKIKGLLNCKIFWDWIGHRICIHFNKIRIVNRNNKIWQKASSCSFKVEYSFIVTVTFWHTWGYISLMTNNSIFQFRNQLGFSQHPKEYSATVSDHKILVANWYQRFRRFFVQEIFVSIN